MKNQTEKKSSFINALAWISIIFAALGFFSSLLQTLIVNIFLSKEQIVKAFEDPQLSNQVPEIIIFLVSNLNVLAPMFMLFSVLFFLVSLGLLKRKNWARLAFIIFLVIGITSSVLALIFQSKLMPEFHQIKGDIPGFDPNAMIKSVKIFNVFINIIHVGLYAWIIKKLISKEIKNEFYQK